MVMGFGSCPFECGNPNQQRVGPCPRLPRRRCGRLGEKGLRGVALQSPYGLLPRNAAAPPPTPHPGTPALSVAELKTKMRSCPEYSDETGRSEARAVIVAVLERKQNARNKADT